MKVYVVIRQYGSDPPELTAYASEDDANKAAGNCDWIEALEVIPAGGTGLEIAGK